MGSPWFRRRRRAADTRAALQHLREDLETLQRIACVGVLAWDVESGGMLWSEQTPRLLGLSPGEDKPGLEGFLACVHPEDRRGLAELMREAAAAEADLRLVVRVPLPDGTIRHVELRGETLEGGGVLRGTLQDVTERECAEERIRALAHFDSLTGLANRRRFVQQMERGLERARRTGDVLALLYIDLDEFKRINDTLGHAAGDELLRAVADRLYENVRAIDLIGRVRAEPAAEISRLGGDEFAVLLSGLHERDEAATVAARILARLPEPARIEGREVSTTGSIGIATFPEDGDTVDLLLRGADRALQRAKQRGRNDYQFFQDEHARGLRDELTLEGRLRDAVTQEEFTLVYQPRVDLESDRIVGAEALLRWNDAELGDVSPREFIPLAEQSGLIVPLGRFVLGRACAQGAAWRAAGLGDLRISVNVSTRQFRQDRLVQAVAGAVTEAGFDPTLLEIEITESAMLQDDEATARTLGELRAMGVRIALDDFGTGYSSLGYLPRFPLDILKLDRSLVRDLNNSPNVRGVVTAVISMAGSLGLEVVAEGVDQPGQTEFLRAHGCTEIQGFWIAGGLPPHEFEALVRQRDGGGSAAAGR